ncbi:hypothetical protein PPACK8108_LOCUS6986 [Phakopsora pachyrhizi]|uniref:Uncharacterized protein n=1 Tax=Phakopsora pachyrhizi TaxID=170000 RepID=A0AAV0ATA7_PHAPC|nr:hypothetical protein PPACK8108_LOCUS6986 [Phakopsora pachyrhizi]
MRERRCKEVFLGFCWVGRKWMVPLEREEKVRWGAHQGQSGWSKTTGATDL